MMVVLSLFDGISCGMVALKRLGLKPDLYYCSEINQPAEFISAKNHSDIIRLGDVTNWRDWDIDWTSINLLIAGSPCQGFSSAGKAGGTKAIINGETVVIDTRERYIWAKSVGAEFLSQSHLFWEFILIMDHVKAYNPQVKFMLENVKMSGNNMDMITKAMGVEPVFINSALVSAQNRQRYYWCNWWVPQPVDRGILLVDILEHDPADPVIMTDVFVKRQSGRKCLVDDFNRKSASFSAMEYVKNGRQGDYIRMDTGSYRAAVAVGRRINNDGKRDDYNPEIKRVQLLEVQEHSKSRCLSTVQKDTLYSDLPPGRCIEKDVKTRYRKFTPVECERLQGLPDYYTHGVSNTQRYMMIGNAWQCDTIEHIFFWMFIDVKLGKISL